MSEIVHIQKRWYDGKKEIMSNNRTEESFHCIKSSNSSDKSDLFSPGMLATRCNCRKCIGGVVYHLRKESVGNSRATRFVPARLKSYQYTSKIKGSRKEDIIQQCYLNEEMAEIEAWYCVPIEEAEADVILFGAFMNGRRFYNIVTEGDTNTYTSPAICHQPKNENETLLDVFKIKLGQLGPGCEVTIAIKYISRLPSSKTVPRKYFSAILSRLENFALCCNFLSCTIVREVTMDQTVDAGKANVGNCAQKKWNNIPLGGRSRAAFTRP